MISAKKKGNIQQDLEDTIRCFTVVPVRSRISASCWRRSCEAMISSDLVKGVIQGSTGCSVPHFPSWNGQPQVAVKHCETMELQHDTKCVWKNDGKLVKEEVYMISLLRVASARKPGRDVCWLPVLCYFDETSRRQVWAIYWWVKFVVGCTMTPEPLSCLVWSTPPNGGRWGVPPWFFLAAWRFNHGLLYLAVFDDVSWFSKRVLITWPWVCLKMEYEIGYPKFSWWIVIVP